jgi:hypothetical protein
MKFRKSRPSIAACMGRRIVHSPPKKPAASPAKKTDAASAHSSAVTTNPPPRWQTPRYGPVRCPVEAEIAAVPRRRDPRRHPATEKIPGGVEGERGDRVGRAGVI